jgi:transcriptional regulator with XRE-family HTH domain
MLIAEQFGKLIKQGRMKAGLRQEDLASAAGVSRTVLSRLEQEKPGPVQTDVLDRVLGALNLRPQVKDLSANEDRKIARLEHQIKLDRQRDKHLRIAVNLASDEEAAVDLIGKARERVELWRRNKSCSPFYIERWSQILAQPARTQAREMTSLGEWESALFQNSPWSWAWS